MSHNELTRLTKQILTKYGFSIATEGEIKKHDKKVRAILSPKSKFKGKFGGKTPDFVCYKYNPLDEPLWHPTKKDHKEHPPLIPELFIIEAVTGKEILHKVESIIEKKYGQFYPTYLLCFEHEFKKIVKGTIARQDFFFKLQKNSIGLMLFDLKERAIIIEENPKQWIFFHGIHKWGERMRAKYSPIEVLTLHMSKELAKRLTENNGNCIFVPMEVNDFYYLNLLGEGSTERLLFEYPLIIKERGIKTDEFIKFLKPILVTLTKKFPSAHNEPVFFSWSIPCYWNHKKRKMLVGFDIPSFLYAIEKMDRNLGFKEQEYIDFSNRNQLVKMNYKDGHHSTDFCFSIFLNYGYNTVAVILKGGLNHRPCGEYNEDIEVEEAMIYSQNGLIFKKRPGNVLPYYTLKSVKIIEVPELESKTVRISGTALMTQTERYLLRFKGKLSLGEIPIIGQDSVASEKLVRDKHAKFRAMRVQLIETDQMSFLEIPLVRDMSN